MRAFLSGCTLAVIAACLAFPAGAQEEVRTLALPTRVPAQCIAFDTGWDSTVIVGRGLLAEIAAGKQAVGDGPQDLAADRARTLLDGVGSTTDRFGCRLSDAAKDDFDGQYLLVDLIKDGKAAIASGTGPDARLQKTARYSEVHCGDRFPAGHISLDVPGGIVFLSIPTCIV